MPVLVTGIHPSASAGASGALDPATSAGMTNPDCRRSLSLRQLGHVALDIESLGVGQQLPVLDIAPVHHVAHGKLGDPARPGARHVGDLNDVRGHVVGTGAGGDLLLDAVAQGIGKEAGARCLVGIDEIGRSVFVAYDFGEVPKARPELGGIGDRITVQVVIIVEGLTRAGCHPG